MDMLNPALKLRKRRRLRLSVATAVVIVALLVVLLLRLGPALPRADRSSLWIDTVQRGDMLREVRATGTLVSRTSRWLAAATAAEVEQILVWPGTAVQPDTLLMKLCNQPGHVFRPTSACWIPRSSTAIACCNPARSPTATCWPWP